MFADVWPTYYWTAHSYRRRRKSKLALLFFKTFQMHLIVELSLGGSFSRKDFLCHMEAEQDWLLEILDLRGRSELW